MRQKKSVFKGGRNRKGLLLLRSSEHVSEGIQCISSKVNVIVGAECSLRQMDIEAMQERNRIVIEGYSK